MYFALKTVLSALIIAGVSELSKRSTFMGALLLSLPLTTVLAFCWIYWESRDAQKIITMSYEVFWLVIPSLAFFLILPALLKLEVKFSAALLISSLVVAGIYFVATWLWHHHVK